MDRFFKCGAVSFAFAPPFANALESPDWLKPCCIKCKLYKGICRPIGLRRVQVHRMTLVHESGICFGQKAMMTTVEHRHCTKSEAPLWCGLYYRLPMTAKPNALIVRWRGNMTFDRRDYGDIFEIQSTCHGLSANKVKALARSVEGMLGNSWTCTLKEVCGQWPKVWLWPNFLKNIINLVTKE